MIASATEYGGSFQTPGDVQEYFHEKRADYSAAKHSRFKRRRKGLPASGSHADYHYRSESEFWRMMETARDMARNDYIVGQGIRRFVANIVQDGFRLEAQTPNSDLNAELEGMWNDWSEDSEQVSLTGEDSWYDIETLTLENVLTDGDICHLPTTEGSLDTMEAHRLRTPHRTTRKIIHGVLLDDRRRRLRYHFAADDVRIDSTAVKLRDMEEVDYRDPMGDKQVYHVYRKNRFSQTRGVTVLAPLVDPAGMLDDIQFARLVQQQVVSAWVILRSRPNPVIGGEGGRNCSTDGGVGQTNDLSGFNRPISEVQPGQEIKADDGEQVTGFNPNVPNPTFFDHVSLILGVIAANLDMPVAMLMLDPSNTNFSGWRGAVDQARLRFRQCQKWYSGRLHSPVYRWKVDNWIEQGRITEAGVKEAGKALFKHCWHPPRWPYIQPLEDASADLLRDRNALTSKRRLHGSNGASWDDLSTEIVDDNAMGIEKAIAKEMEFKSRFPEVANPPTWRDFLSMPTPDGVQVATGNEPKQNEPETAGATANE